MSETVWIRSYIVEKTSIIPILYLF